MTTNLEIKVPLVAEGLSFEEIELAINSLKSGSHTMGAEVAKFELKFAEFLNVEGAVMVNSGSSANLLAIESLVRSTPRRHPKIKPGSLIAVPAILWPTTLWPIVQLGLRPLLIDTESDGLGMNLDELYRAKKIFCDELSGIFVIHPLGLSLDLEKLRGICEELDLILIEDTCESLGAGNSASYAGTIGELGTFSFYYSHHITTIEGGMVVSNNGALLDDLRSMRAHGWTRNRSDKDKWKKKENDENGDFLFVTTGFNFRPMEIQGVLGQSQLARFPEFLSRRVTNAERVHEASKMSLLELIGADPESVASKPQKGPVPHSWMTFPFKARGSDVDLDQIRKLFERFGIATRPILAGDFTLQPAFNLHGIEILGALENAKAISKRSFMIGNHQSLTELQIQRICDALTSTTHLT